MVKLYMMTKPVSMLRTALSILTGNERHAAFTGVRLWELARMASWVIVQC